MQNLEALIVLVPFGITVMNEILKALPFVPVTSKNVKWVALAIALAFVGLQTASAGTFDPALAPTYAAEVVAVTAASIGFYEGLKPLFKKFEGFIK